MPIGPENRIDEALADSAGLIWVDILGPDEHASLVLQDWLCRHFHFHHLAVEDALAESHIAKIDDWGEYLYIVFHVAGFEPDSDKLDLHELDVFLGPNYLITYHTAPLDDSGSGSQEHRARPARSPAQWRTTICSIVSSSWQSTSSLFAIEHLDEKMDQIQNAVIENADHQVTEGDLPAQACRHLAPQGAVSPARGAHAVGPRSVQARPGKAPRVFSRPVRPRRANSRYLREPARLDRRSGRDLPLGRLQPHQRHHEGADDRHRHVPADVVSGRLLRHELLRRQPGFHQSAAQSLALLGQRRDHGNIALLHLDLRAAPEVVLERPQNGRFSVTARALRTARWRLKPFDAGRIESLSRSARLSPLVAQLLINRGIEDPVRAIAFLEAKMGALHDPELLPGASRAAERIVRAIRERRKIVIYGDYDVDGVCGTSVLWACLRLAGATELDYYIPHRVEEGYGVNAEALRRLATEEKASLIVTVDCGISAVKEAELARSWDSS